PNPGNYLAHLNRAEMAVPVQRESRTLVSTVRANSDQRLSWNRSSARQCQDLCDYRVGNVAIPANWVSPVLANVTELMRASRYSCESRDLTKCHTERRHPRLGFRLRVGP